MHVCVVHARACVFNEILTRKSWLYLHFYKTHVYRHGLETRVLDGSQKKGVKIKSTVTKESNSFFFFCGVSTILTVLNTEKLTQNTVFMSRVSHTLHLLIKVFSL